MPSHRDHRCGSPNGPARPRGRRFCSRVKAASHRCATCTAMALMRHTRRDANICIFFRWQRGRSAPSPLTYAKKQPKGRKRNSRRNPTRKITARVKPPCVPPQPALRDCAAQTFCGYASCVLRRRTVPTPLVRRLPAAEPPQRDQQS